MLREGVTRAVAPTMLPMSDTPGEQQPKINIQVRDEQKYGTYANFLVVSHSPHEFTLDFCQIMQTGEGRIQADVVSRVKVAPTMVGRVMNALATNMDAYEKKFGAVPHVG